MKLIFNNVYIKVEVFESHRDFSRFMDSLNIEKIELSKSYGDKYFCLIAHDSLSGEKKFIVYFESDYKECNLSMLIWQSQKVWVLYIGIQLYLLDEKMSIACFEVSTPLIGLHVTTYDTLLVLEEGSVWLVDSKGKVLKTELFDLIEDFHIEDDLLTLQVGDETKLFSLKTDN